MKTWFPFDSQAQAREHIGRMLEWAPERDKMLLRTIRFHIDEIWKYTYGRVYYSDTGEVNLPELERIVEAYKLQPTREDADFLL